MVVGLTTMSMITRIWRVRRCRVIWLGLLGRQLGGFNRVKALDRYLAKTRSSYYSKWFNVPIEKT